MSSTLPVTCSHGVVSARADVVDLRDVTVVLGGHVVLDHLSLAIDRGELWAVTGDNGAGKTTLLRVIVGLLTPTSGHVHVLGTTAAHARRHTAYVAQHDTYDRSFPVTALDVVAMGLARVVRPFGRLDRTAKRAAMDALSIVGLDDRARKSFGELSGGQRQRVLVARAIAQDAQLILLDESLSGVDAEQQRRILDVLERLRAEGRSIVISTHDPDLAARSGTHHCHLSPAHRH
jgi:ABC-type Mn2+/Zn2+ transport system ATPase subunit